MMRTVNYVNFTLLLFRAVKAESGYESSLVADGNLQRITQSLFSAVLDFFNWFSA